MEELKQRLELILPIYDKEDDEIIDSDLINSFTKNITEVCGGCNRTHGLGYWINDNKEQIEDINVYYEWYFNKDNYNDIATYLYCIISELIHIYNQEGVSIVLNDVLYIINMKDLEDSNVIKDIFSGGIKDENV